MLLAQGPSSRVGSGAARRTGLSEVGMGFLEPVSLELKNLLSLRSVRRTASSELGVFPSHLKELPL